MKLYLDIITNHTADVIQYRECVNAACPIARARIIPTRAGRAAGAAINAGFAGDGVRTAATSRASPIPTTPTRRSCRRPRPNVKVPAG
jgi:hypothetical protein